MSYCRTSAVPLPKHQQILPAWTCWHPGHRDGFLRSRWTSTWPPSNEFHIAQQHPQHCMFTEPEPEGTWGSNPPLPSLLVFGVLLQAEVCHGWKRWEGGWCEGRRGLLWCHYLTVTRALESLHTGWHTKHTAFLCMTGLFWFWSDKR